MTKNSEIVLDPSLTPAQRDIITSRGKNLLVSASAGSGKTRVMIERIIHMIKTREASADDILVVTFTKAAAGEMKTRLIKALEEEPNKDDYILEQLSLVPSSTICTLHSYCAKLLKTYFYVVGLDPSFIMIDEIESNALKNKAMIKLIDARFVLKDKEFFELLDIFSVNRKEDNFRELIFKFYDELLTKLDADAWIKTSIDRAYNDNLDDNECAKFVNNFVATSFERFIVEADKLNIVLATSGANKLIEVVNSILLNALRIKTRNTYQENKLNLEGFCKVLSIPRKVEDGQELLKEQVVELKEKYKELKSLAEKHYNLDGNDNFKFKINETKRRVLLLYEYTNHFKAIYDELKKEKVALDFADLERYTLKLLENNEITEAIKETYKHIFVDEYQDTNPIQEKLITTLARKNNLFMVGDVKQSIYKFRASRPEIFVGKYKKYSTGDDNFSEAKNLNHNFRSHQDILAFCNDVFKNCMTEDFGQVNYLKDAMLVKKIEANLISSNAEPIVKLDIITSPSTSKKEDVAGLDVYSVKNHKEDDVKEAKKAEKEGLCIVQEIKNILGKNLYSPKDKSTRPINYSDIVILTASRGDYLQKALKELKKAGIPYTTDIMLNVFDDYYVKVLLSLLKLSINRFGDVELLASLNSDLFDFSVNDLATIRQSAPDKKFFYEAFYSAKNLDSVKPILKKKIDKFITILDKINYFSKYSKVDELLSSMLYEFGFYDKIVKSENGERSLVLIGKLKTFLSGKSYNTAVVKFLDYINENKIEFQQDTSDDGVKVTTIHKSKGLEFPVVILMGAGQDILKKNQGEFVFNETFGIGLDYYDNKRRVKQRLVIKNAMKLEQNRSDKEERMRLLYVALTRAINHLIIVGVVNENKEPVKRSEDAGCFYDWILPAVIKNYNEGQTSYNLKIDTLTNFDLCKDGKEQNKTKVKIEEGEKAYIDEILSMLSYDYPYSKSVDMPVKTSVSELMKAGENEHVVPVLFTEENENAIKKGNCYHKIMQGISFKIKNKEDFKKEIERLLKSGLITSEDINIVSLDGIYDLVTSSKMQELSRSQILREKEFIALTRLDKSKGSNDSVVIQGVVDFIAITDDGIIIGDYKTNNFKSEAKFVEKYKKQLDIYAGVIAESYGKPVLQKFIYSFGLKKFIYV